MLTKNLAPAKLSTNGKIHEISEMFTIDSWQAKKSDTGFRCLVKSKLWKILKFVGM